MAEPIHIYGPDLNLIGPLDPNDHFIGMSKGDDIPSASPLVIGVDGDYFDVTGTTDFSVMSVIANRFFIIQFDAILTVTNGASIVIPGGDDFTTAPGDQFICFSPEANIVRIVSITRADGIATVTEISEDLSPQLGGFLDPNGNYVGQDIGSDIIAASPLVIETDGDYFDVSGNASFAVMTTAADRFFILRFDGSCTITHGAGITLPGNVDYTTEPGDHMTCSAVSANNVRVVGILRDSGEPVVLNISQDLSPQLGAPLDTDSHQVQWSKGADVASATALPILTDGNSFDVTGNSTITSIDTTGRVGTVIKLHFDAILTLAHHPTNLVLPTEADIDTAVGDEAEFMEHVSGGYRCTNYSRADGTALVDADFSVENESTDTTCFCAFFTAATGVLGPKTNAAFKFDSSNGNVEMTTLNGATISFDSLNNVVIGDPTAGNSLINSARCVFIGLNAGSSVTNGVENIAIGNDVMSEGPGVIGLSNVGIVQGALQNIENGDFNVAIGERCMFNLTNADHNTALGRRAGYSVTTGNRNVFLGFEAGKDQVTTGSDLLYIDNTNTATPLGFGSFAQRWMIINDNLRKSVTETITASTNSSQGDEPLTTDHNEISVCANAGDAVTLPLARYGMCISIVNNGAESADVFPASTGNIDDAGVNVAKAQAAGTNRMYIARNSVNWDTFG